MILGFTPFGVNKERHNRGFSLTESFWQKLEAKAKDHDMTLDELLNRTIFVGDRVSDSEEKGGRAFLIEDGHLIKINFFKNGNGQKPPQG